MKILVAIRIISQGGVSVSNKLSHIIKLNLFKLVQVEESTKI